jgi:plasmid stabilization system protein ParE
MTDPTTLLALAAERDALRTKKAIEAALRIGFAEGQNQAKEEIEKLRAAVQDLAKHVWRGDWDKLKPETRELLEEGK